MLDSDYAILNIQERNYNKLPILYHNITNRIHCLLERGEDTLDKCR